MTNTTNTAAQAAPVVAASELSDEQIHEIMSETVDCDYKQGLKFARAVLAAATPAASVTAMWQALEKLASTWDGVKWDEGDDVGATIRHDFAMYAEEFGAAPAVQQPAEGGWISVDERLPEVPEDDGEEFNITCRRTNGKSYVFSAYYLNSKGVISDDDPETVFMGWYLRTEHPDYDGWYTPVCDAGDVVTHWQPLPAPPRERA